MLFYNIHNTKVAKFSQILKDPSFVCKIPMPNTVCEKKSVELAESFSKLGNKEEYDKKLIDEYYLKTLEYKILQYECLYKALAIYPSQDAKNEYKEVFKHEFNTDKLKILRKKIDKLISKLETMTEDMNSGKEISFDDLIAALENILGLDLSEKFIYVLHTYEAKAVEKLEKDA